MRKLLYTVTSKYLLLKSLLYLLINISSEAHNYIIIITAFKQSEVKKTAWRSVGLKSESDSILVWQFGIAFLKNIQIITPMLLPFAKTYICETGLSY